MTAHRFESVYRHGERVSECVSCGMRGAWPGARDECISRGVIVSADALDRRRATARERRRHERREAKRAAAERRARDFAAEYGRLKNSEAAE